MTPPTVILAVALVLVILASVLTIIHLEAQLRIAGFLHRHGGEWYGLELCKRLKLARGTIYARLSHLERRGLVTSRTTYGDGDGRRLYRFAETLPEITLAPSMHDSGTYTTRQP
jgi:predicted transcriptional regulator